MALLDRILKLATSWQAIAIGAVVLVALSFGTGWHFATLQANEACTRAVQDAADTAKKLCDSAKMQSEENGNANQDKHSALDDAFVNSVRPSRCIPVRTPCKAAISQQTGTAEPMVQSEGIDRGDVLRLGYDAQAVNIDLESCKALLNGIYKANGR